MRVMGYHAGKLESLALKWAVCDHFREYGGEYRWKGTFEQLETYFADNLPGAGSWSSPSGGVKLFTAEDFQIKRQRSKKLVIVRDTSDMYILNFLSRQPRVIILVLLIALMLTQSTFTAMKNMIVSRDHICVFSDNFSTSVVKIYTRVRSRQAKI